MDPHLHSKASFESCSDKANAPSEQTGSTFSCEDESPGVGVIHFVDTLPLGEKGSEMKATWVGRAARY